MPNNNNFSKYDGKVKFHVSLGDFADNEKAMDKLANYLEEHKIITEVNSDFPFPGDPGNNDNVNKIKEKLKEKNAVLYSSQSIEVTDKSGCQDRLKCLFDINLESANQISEICRHIYNEYLK